MRQPARSPRRTYRRTSCASCTPEWSLPSAAVRSDLRIWGQAFGSIRRRSYYSRSGWAPHLAPCPPGAPGDGIRYPSWLRDSHRATSRATIGLSTSVCTFDAQDGALTLDAEDNAISDLRCWITFKDAAPTLPVGVLAITVGGARIDRVRQTDPSLVLYRPDRDDCTLHPGDRWIAQRSHAARTTEQRDKRGADCHRPA